MKLINSRIEKEIRNDLEIGRDNLFNSPKVSSIKKFLLRLKPKLNTAYVLDWLPEQGEDIYTIITDDKEILILEVPRSDDSNEFVAEFLSLEDYKSKLKGNRERIKLVIALDLIDQSIE